MAIVGNLSVLVQAQTADFTAGMRRARQDLRQTSIVVQETSRETRNLTNNFNNTNRSLLGLRASGGPAAATLGTLVKSFAAVTGVVLGLRAATNGLRDILRIGVDLHNLRQSFVTLTGSAEDGRKEFAFVRDTANDLGLDLQQLAGSYRGLTAATRGTDLAGQDTRELFLTLTRTARAYGLSTEQVSRALLAFEQIISKGKVAQQELRLQLSQAIPGAVQIAARAFGVNTRTLEDMVAKGLDASTFVRAFTAQLAREAPSATNLAGKGFARLGNEILLLKDTIAQSGILRFFDQIATRWAEILQRLRETREEQRRITQAHIDTTMSQARLTFSAADPALQQAYQRVQQQITEAESDLTALEKRAQRVRTIPLLGSLVTGHEIGLAQQRLRALRREERNLADALQQDFSALTAEGVARVKQVAAEQEATRQSAAQQQIHMQRLDIAERTEALMTAQAEAEQRAKTEQQQRVSMQQSLLEGLQHEVDLLTLSADALRQKTILQQTYTTEGRAQAEALSRQITLLQNQKTAQEQLAARNKEAVAAIANRAQEEARFLAGLQQELDLQRLTEAELRQKEIDQANLTRAGKEEAQALLEQVNLVRQRKALEQQVVQQTRDRDMQQLQEEAEQYQRLSNIATEAADLVTYSLEEMAATGKISFKNLQEDFSRFVLHALADAIQLREGLASLFRAGLQAGINALGSLSTAGATAGIAGGGATLDASAGAGADFVSVPTRQQGGPVMSQRAYLVGEQGPELFIPHTAGRITPHRQTAMVMSVPTRQQGGPVMSQRAHLVGKQGPELFIPHTAGRITPHRQTAMVMSIPTRQQGGPVMSQRAYLVGEQGPELFVPRQAGRIEPNAQTGNPSVTVVMNIQTPDVASFRASERQLGRRAGSALALALKGA